MAVFQLIDTSSSSFVRFHSFILIILLFLCLISHSYSSSISPVATDRDTFNWNKRLYAENYRPDSLTFQPSSPFFYGFNSNQYPAASKSRLTSLMLRAALLQGNYRHYRQHREHADNRRYVPQGFHAMRG
ncbi:unnamed protein product [Adineta ricciae]|uniref:Uncharacterized protein n=1 Tax=Adineta ricciae TaxID=249248 RepID=A0A814KHD2_ADIRI|nr:unnamed protein product [Adineta ricciae]